jgi:hypothetical protein
MGMMFNLFTHLPNLSQRFSAVLRLLPVFLKEFFCLCRTLVKQHPLKVAPDSDDGQGDNSKGRS